MRNTGETNMICREYDKPASELTRVVFGLSYKLRMKGIIKR